MDNIAEFNAVSRLYDLQKEVAKILDKLDAHQRALPTARGPGRPYTYPFASVPVDHSFGFTCSFDKMVRLVRTNNRILAPKLFILRSDWDCGYAGVDIKNCKVIRIQ